MVTAQQIGQKVQEQTLGAVRQTQDAAVQVLTAWTEPARKVPGFAELTNGWPTASDTIDANFDFAQRLLDSQREFAGRLVAAATTSTSAPKAAPKLPAPKAVTSKPAPAAAKKPAPRKSTAAKKSAPARSSKTTK